MPAWRGSTNNLVSQESEMKVDATKLWNNNDSDFKKARCKLEKVPVYLIKYYGKSDKIININFYCMPCFFSLYFNGVLKKSSINYTALIFLFSPQEI